MIESQTIQIIITLLLISFVFFAFIREFIAPEIAALGGVAVLIALGIIKGEDFLGVFSNSATMIVGAMFILSAALERTGVVNVIADYASRAALKHGSLAVGGILLGVMIASVFINNTSVVVIMTPVMISLGGALKKSPSKLLIPLSYVSIFAGTCTLIGSSTNIIVDGVARSKGLEPFGMFEITMPGLIMAASGALYLYLIGRHFLPDRQNFGGFLSEMGEQKYITKLVIPEKSPLIGKTIKEAGLTSDKGVEVLHILRGDDSRFTRLNSVKLQEGDRLVMSVNQQELIGMHDSKNVKLDSTTLDFFDKIRKKNPDHADARIVMEAIIGRRSKLIGIKVGDLNEGNRYESAIMGVHRQKGRISQRFDKVRLQFGDKILLEGTPAGLKKLFDNREVINLVEPRVQAYRKRKAPIAIAAIGLVLFGSAFNLLPIASLAFIAAVAVVIFGCLDSEEAYHAIEWRILMLIFAMMGLSIAMEDTGAAELIVTTIMSQVSQMPPWVILSIIYLLTSCMTEIFSNNAAAVILTSIAIQIATQLGIDPRPFAVAVMFGASASFATPIGYQTNTFVYNAGGYKFMDFVKVGLPLNIVLWLVASFIIPMFWSF